MDKKKKRIEPLAVGNFEVMDASDLLSHIDSLLGAGSALTLPQEPEMAQSLPYVAAKGQGFYEEQQKEIDKGKELGLSVDHYARECYNWMQMREIRLGLQQRVPTEVYEDPFYTAEQMREIRLGLLMGLDVSKYKKLVNTAKEMAKIRRKLLQAEYNINPKRFAQTIEDEETGIVVHISEDCMSASITFTKDVDMTLGGIKKLLAKNDIVFGISEEKISRALEQKAAGQKYIVAEGQRGKNGENGRYKFFFNPMLPGKPRELEDGSVDYTQIHEVDSVGKGDVVAKYIPAVPGMDGKTVTGIVVKSAAGKELRQLTGQGFFYHKESMEYISTMDGFAFADPDVCTLNVWNIYVVEGDVNRYNGHITYDGIIHIKGNVGDMAMIEATGNIVVEGTVESAYLIAGKNVILKRGMNGGTGGIIKAGRKVMGNFFESVEIYAGDDVEANYFMNCFIQTDGRLMARGRKGRVIGGNIQALAGVEAVSIGNYNQTSTILDVGNIAQTDDRRITALTKLHKADEELSQLEEGKNKLKIMLGEYLAVENELYKKTEHAMVTMEEQKMELEDYLRYLELLEHRANMAQIVIHGNLQEGVRIILGGKRRDIQPISGRRVVIKRETKGV